MLEIRSRLEQSPPESDAPSRARLELPFDLRQKSRLHAMLDSGEEVAIQLPRGEVLRGGDLLAASDGRVIEVVARAERLLHVECDSPRALARAAYHLGNRHVAVQLGDGFLRLAADHVLEQMLHGLGAHLRAIEAPFEPEAGAYGGAHSHDDGHGHRARIHEYGSPAGDDHHHPHPHHSGE